MRPDGGGRGGRGGVQGGEGRERGQQEREARRGQAGFLHWQKYPCEQGVTIRESEKGRTAASFPRSPSNSLTSRARHQSPKRSCRFLVSPASRCCRASSLSSSTPCSAPSAFFGSPSTSPSRICGSRASSVVAVFSSPFIASSPSASRFDAFALLPLPPRGSTARIRSCRRGKTPVPSGTNSRGSRRASFDAGEGDRSG